MIGLGSDKNTKMSENGEIYTAGKNFTLLPALTGWTNSTSVAIKNCFAQLLFDFFLSVPFLFFHPAQSAPIGSTTSTVCVSHQVVIKWEGQSNIIV